MAMTKAEQARMKELETALAMHWPAYPVPAHLTKEEIDLLREEIPRKDKSVAGYGDHIKAARGWFYNTYSRVVTRGWSDGWICNRDSEFGDGASRMEGNKMFATKQAAAMAMRIEMTREMADQLARVDRIIAGDE